MALVTFRHLRKLKYCAPGIRQWCQRNDFDMRRFHHGVPSDELRSLGCPLAVKAADLADLADQEDKQ